MWTESGQRRQFGGRLGAKLSSGMIHRALDGQSAPAEQPPVKPRDSSPCDEEAFGGLTAASVEDVTERVYRLWVARLRLEGERGAW